MRKQKFSEAQFLAYNPLVEQVTDVLRRDVKNGRWRQVLPPERSLCKEVQVSRPTLRKALHRLQKEKFIKIIPGHSARILPRRPKIKCHVPLRRVVMLAHYPLYLQPRWQLLVVDELRYLLSSKGYHFEFLCHHHLRWKTPGTLLETLVKQYPASLWILSTQPEPVQRWFQDRNLNAIVYGTPHEGIRFPSIDYDHRAICRHAAGMFLGLGHRHIAFFSCQTGGAGVLAGEQGFREAFPSAGPNPPVPLINRHNGSVEKLCDGFKKLRMSRQPPTAILVSSAENALTLFTFMFHLGLRVPGHVSLISCTDDYLNQIIPPIACYQMETEKKARLICQLIDEAQISSLSPRHIRIFPKFRRGGTLARPL